MGEPPLIKVHGVSKSFRIPAVRRETVREHVLGFFRPPPSETLSVLRDVNLEVRRGETVGIMGRNGSGKSTLLKILCSIYEPDSGSVVVRAPVTPILELGIGWNPELNAVDNILVLATVMGMTLGDARSSVDEILSFAGLERFANLELKHFSSGMASRLAYSVAFKAVQEVLVLDEVFAVGDAGFKTRCEDRYRRLSAEGYTVVLVSHDPIAISTFCSRALLLEGGEIVMNDTGPNVAASYLQVTSCAADEGPLSPSSMRTEATLTG
jgi:ABC-type polysaccharide/polyol phosphate transport system ATPase subunit